ncbi:MAG: large-conductance mechanosensitive channel protein MscL [Alphaproteobacteria bacterium]|nr:large-conductance mechanosensitive channel protein MscL [Alphaproteobacteria bacterium]
MKNFINEFKKFAMRGNVIDMAVGIIIGAAFGKIVDSLVKDVIMPPIGLLLGKVDFSNLFITLKEGAIPAPYASLDAAQKAGAVTMNIGIFVNALISFTIVAFAVFILIKAINELQAKMLKKEAEEAAANPTTKTCPYCFSEIDIKATKCPHCTSELSATKAPKAEEKAQSNAKTAKKVKR